MSAIIVILLVSLIRSPDKTPYIDVSEYLVGTMSDQGISNVSLVTDNEGSHFSVRVESDIARGEVSHEQVIAISDVAQSITRSLYGSMTDNTDVMVDRYEVIFTEDDISYFAVTIDTPDVKAYYDGKIDFADFSNSVVAIQVKY